jgi:hypothetical protein
MPPITISSFTRRAVSCEETAVTLLVSPACSHRPLLHRCVWRSGLQEHRTRGGDARLARVNGGPVRLRVSPGGAFSLAAPQSSRPSRVHVSRTSSTARVLQDISYADVWYTHNDTIFGYETVLNGYMNWMQNVTAVKPYMVLPGNHEADCYSPICMQNTTLKDALMNFTAYNYRFRMPAEESGAFPRGGRASIHAPASASVGQRWSALVSVGQRWSALVSVGQRWSARSCFTSVNACMCLCLFVLGGVGANMWYSFNYGPVHFVSFDTETDFDHAPEGSQVHQSLHLR